MDWKVDGLVVLVENWVLGERKGGTWFVAQGRDEWWEWWDGRGCGIVRLGT